MFAFSTPPEDWKKGRSFLSVYASQEEPRQTGLENGLVDTLSEDEMVVRSSNVQGSITIILSRKVTTMVTWLARISQTGCMNFVDFKGSPLRNETKVSWFELEGEEDPSQMTTTGRAARNWSLSSEDAAGLGRSWNRRTFGFFHERIS